MAKLRLLKTGHGDLTLAEWDKDRPETVATAETLFSEHFTPGRLAFRLDGPGQTRADPAVRRHGAGDPDRPGHPGRLSRQGPFVNSARRGIFSVFRSPGQIMIRTGYLRWEIEADDVRSQVDAQAREVIFLARPTHRVVRVKATAHAEAAERFARGEATYDAVLRTLTREGGEVELTIPDVGPHRFRYSEADRARMLRYWMEKLQREASAFAHEVVRAASSFPQLVISSPALRAGYARLVEGEIFRVIEGTEQAPAHLRRADLDRRWCQSPGRPRAGRRRARARRRRAQGVPRVLPVRLHHRQERRQVLPHPAPAARR